MTVLRPAELGWQSGDGFRFHPLQPTAGKAGFTMLENQATGLLFTNVINARRHLTNQILLNGSGVAAGDVDGDGWCDLYFCSIDGPNGLYRNLGGWRFADVTEEAGVACPDLDATGAVFTDLEGDGDLDLVVNSVGGGSHLFLNGGKGRYTKVAQINGRKGGMSAAFGDLDGDGFLDLYIANYRTTALMDMPNARAEFKVVEGRNTIDKINGRAITDPELTNRFTVGRFGLVEELGEVDAVYRNRGGTGLTEVAFTSGAFLDTQGQSLKSPPFDWGLSVVIRDLNGDRLPDIYVCNDFETPDRFWINRGRGRFQAAPTLTLRKSSLFSMGVDFADINRDGHDDFLVSDMLNREHRLRLTQMLPLPPLPEEVASIDGRPQYMVTTLQLNRGDGTYAEIGQLSGVEASDWSWLPIFLDVDLDGWEDLLISSGHERAARDLDVADQMKLLRRNRRNLPDAEIFQARRAFPRLATGNLAFRNRGDLTFEEVSGAWAFNFKGVSQGMALADLDNDGDLDVVVNKSNTAAGLYRNNTDAPRVAVRLRGERPNSQGIGAKIKVTGPGLPLQSQEIICGGRYLSCDQAVRVFAAGSATNLLDIEITWPRGKVSRIRQAAANQFYEIEEGAAQTEISTPGANAPAMFADSSAALDHVHQDQPFNDFLRQPLLPNKLSQLGPGVAWADLNGDGWDDLVIGSGSGGQIAVYTNDARGSLARQRGPMLDAVVRRDQTGLVLWQSDSNSVLLAGSANYEDGLAAGPGVRRFDVKANRVDDTFPGASASTGPLAMADVDGDGDLDLFVGGRVIPGQYPEAASSALYLNHGGRFELDGRGSKLLTGIGMVSGAVFTDVNGDAAADLVLACDWGSIRFLQNERGVFTDKTEAWGLQHFTGWWNGVTAGDFDNDGRLDLVASNWGRNTKYQSHRAQPLVLYYGDFDGDGTEDLIEAYHDLGLNKLVPERQLVPMAQAMAFLRGRFPSHRAYADASVDDLLGEARAKARSCQANWLESTLFLNRGDHFDARPLPVEAQMAPAFGINVADVDGDGTEDILLAQNFFAVQPETPRYDAGRALWLRGDGQGGFHSVPGEESGLKVYGEQRGSAVSDFDQDGRVDVVIAQNCAATKLYRNIGARPGLRVRLAGPPENPTGIGATIRVAYGNRLGPVREVHAGSGYWSQDSACQVFARAESPSALVVRWPGAEDIRLPLAPDVLEIQVDRTGRVQRLR